jgi:hypothetical protein
MEFLASQFVEGFFFFLRLRYSFNDWIRLPLD